MKSSSKIIVIVVAIVLIGGLYLLLLPSGERIAQVSETEFELVISDRRLNMDPPIIQLNLNDEITFRIISDEEGEFHVHSYEAEIEVGPDDVAVLTFDANLAGRYDLELHLPGPPGEEEGDEIVIGAIEVSP